MKRAAIVGCGNISAVHNAVLSKMENAKLVAVADLIPERAKKLAEGSDAAVYDDYKKMLEECRPDVLHICTPHVLHTPMAEYALKQGIHVFMEKPPVISYEQLETLKTAVKDSKAKLGFCYQNRYNPSIQAVRTLLASGEAGEIKGARGIVTWNRGEAYYTQSGWRGKLATEGGGALINQSIHTMDLLMYLLGEPKWIEASISNHHLKGIIEVEDTMEAYIGFEKKSACFYATTAYCADVAPLIEVQCEKMKIRIEDLDVTYIYPDGETKKPAIEAKETLGKSYWGSGHRDCIMDFYHSLETGEHFSMELPDMESSIRMMLGAYESARNNKVVEL